MAGEFVDAEPGARTIPGSYIVVYENSVSAARMSGEQSGRFGAQVGDVFSSALNGAVLTGLSEREAREMAKDPRVMWVEPDGVVSINAAQANPPSWGQDRVDQRSLPLDSSYTYFYDGTGVDIYIIDTGIRPTHADFGGRVTLAFDAFSGTGADCNGHGTHVASTAAGATYGLAKNARLHAVRVLDCAGSGSFAGVIAGIDYVTAQANANPLGLFVANMSLGGGANASLDAAVNSSVAAGVVYAVAAGNDNLNACTKSPAAAVDAITVGSTTSSDARSSFSNFGTCVDIFAPGSGITAAWHTTDSATNTISGTSMASPHVAGLAALIRDEFPAFSAADVTSEILARATAGVVTSPGGGSPNLLAYTLGGVAPPPPPPPPGDTTPPAVPSGLAATAGSSQVQLSWSANSEPDLAGYNVYRATVAGGPRTLVNTGLVTVTSLTDTGLTNGTTYFYVVSAVDTSTNESAVSAEVSATPVAAPPPPPPPPGGCQGECDN